MVQEEFVPEEGIKCTKDELINYCRTLSIIWIPSEKNRRFKDLSGLTTDELIDYVRTLRKDHYQEEIDDLSKGHTGKMYVFNRLVKEQYWCYIKIKINRTKEGNIVAVISFHEDERM